MERDSKIELHIEYRPRPSAQWEAFWRWLLDDEPSGDLRSQGHIDDVDGENKYGPQLGEAEGHEKENNDDPIRTDVSA